jgi:hypothetical protein
MIAHTFRKFWKKCNHGGTMKPGLDLIDRRELKHAPHCGALRSDQLFSQHADLHGGDLPGLDWEDKEKQQGENHKQGDEEGSKCGQNGRFFKTGKHSL